MGPHLGTRVPIGTFLTNWVPKGSLFISKVPIFPVLGACTRWMSYKTSLYAFAFNVACVKLKFHFCLIITDYFQLRTCFLLTTFGWICAFVANLVVSQLRGILGPHFGCSGSLLGPYSMKNWIPIWSLFQWSEVRKWIGNELPLWTMLKKTCILVWVGFPKVLEIAYFDICVVYNCRADQRTLGGPKGVTFVLRGGQLGCCFKDPD